MTKKEILDYITETPGNTNRAVLSDMLDSFGGGGGAEPLIVNLSAGTNALDHTWQEIYDAVMAGRAVYLKESNSSIYAFAMITKIKMNYYVRFMSYAGEGPVYMSFTATSGDNHPSYDDVV